MKSFLFLIAARLFELGGLGLLGLGILDSSFLVMPLGNDLLMVSLTAAHPARLPYYVLMAAVGSALGCLILDAVSRKGGQKGLEQRVSRRRMDYLKCKVGKRAGWALAAAALMPPPFPFTPVVAAAAVFGYPRGKMLLAVTAARVARFAALGAMAIAFGPRILRLAESSHVQYAIVALIAVSAAASGLSIYRWVKKSPSGPR